MTPRKAKDILRAEPGLMEFLGSYVSFLVC